MGHACWLIKLYEPSRNAVVALIAAWCCMMRTLHLCACITCVRYSRQPSHMQLTCHCSFIAEAAAAAQVSAERAKAAAYASTSARSMITRPITVDRDPPAVSPSMLSESMSMSSSRMSNVADGKFVGSTHKYAKVVERHTLKRHCPTLVTLIKSFMKKLELQEPSFKDVIVIYRWGALWRVTMPGWDGVRGAARLLVYWLVSYPPRLQLAMCRCEGSVTRDSATVWWCQTVACWLLPYPPA